MSRIIGLLKQKALHNSINHFMSYYKELNAGKSKFEGIFGLPFFLDTMDHLHDN